MQGADVKGLLRRMASAHQTVKVKVIELYKINQISLKNIFKWFNIIKVKGFLQKIIVLVCRNKTKNVLIKIKLKYFYK